MSHDDLHIVMQFSRACRYSRQQSHMCVQTAGQFGMPPARLLYFLQASHNTAKAQYRCFVTF